MQNNKKNENQTNINTLQEILNNLVQKKYETKLRAQANIENIQKKSEHTMKQIKKDHLKNFINELSDIVKKFNVIFDISSKNELNKNSVIKGIKLIYKSLSNTIKKYQYNDLTKK